MLLDCFTIALPGLVDASWFERRTLSFTGTLAGIHVRLEQCPAAAEGAKQAWVVLPVYRRVTQI
jgi:hypothetical protein